MTDHDTLLEKLEQHGRILERQTVKLEQIETSLTTIAVQAKEINHINDQLKKLWDNYDKSFGPEGVIAGIKTYQASCPGEALKTSIKQLWGAIFLIVALIGAIKIWG